MNVLLIQYSSILIIFSIYLSQIVSSLYFRFLKKTFKNFFYKLNKLFRDINNNNINA